MVCKVLCHPGRHCLAGSDEPQNGNPVTIGSTDESEIAEETPHGRDAQGERARKQALTHHQHPDVFILLLDQIAADGGKDPAATLLEQAQRWKQWYGRQNR